MTLLIKNRETPSEKYGCEPHKRSIDELLKKGFLIIDKHSGPTSHQETDNVKKVLQIDKAGHSGTLDPKVTGVLIMGLEYATRLMEYMLLSSKEYVCLMYLHKEVDDDKLKDAFKKFTGKIIQKPPVVSAVKRVEREREIYSIDILDIKGKDVLFKVSCQHGTYIRKLCSDLGEFLSCGAHMKELRRIKAGPFTENDNSISVDRLRNLFELHREKKDKKIEEEIRKFLRPMEELLVEFKKVYIRDSAVDTIAHGADLAIPGVLKLDDNIETGDEIAMFTGRGELVGIGLAFLKSNDVMKKKKGAFIKTQKVFMDREIYPKLWEFMPKKDE